MQKLMSKWGNVPRNYLKIWYIHDIRNTVLLTLLIFYKYLLVNIGLLLGQRLRRCANSRLGASTGQKYSSTSTST